MTRTVTGEPLAVTYELTATGRTLTGPLAELREWAQTHCDARTSAPRTPSRA